MTAPIKTIDVTVTRTIPAPAREVYDAWIDPSLPCNVWNEAAKLIMDAKVDGLFYMLHTGKSVDNPHYGRFTILERGKKLQHTWMSKHTAGLESVVTVTFVEKNGETHLTLTHTNLPDDAPGRGHEKGWTHYLERLAVGLVPAARDGGSNRR
jgi:uncharacterized protein YndB with AHSA1/START domain